MKINDAQFIKSAPNISHAPELNHLPEIAFVGRSNVGKSSLLNSLTHRKSLAKTSNTPGKTRLINFYHICYGERKQELVLVDLPGYGYAKVSKTEQAEWGKHLEAYLQQRAQLRLVIQLVDSRQGVQVSDVEMLNWLMFHKLPAVIVLTKIDKLSKNELHQQLLATERRMELEHLPVELLPIVPYSASTHQGRDALWRLLLE